MGDRMKTNQELLNSILSTTQMGQIGIRSALDNHMEPELRTALESQLKEYDSIETQAHDIAKKNGWETEELEHGIRTMTNLMTKARLSYGNRNSKIAAMMIQGNTRGMIVGLKDLHQTEQPSKEVGALSKKLLDCEMENIRQMQGFL